MAKNNNYKQEHAPAQKKKTSKVSNIVIGILCAAVVLGAAVAIVAAVINSQKTVVTPTGTPTVICSISYPDLQTSGEIWQTGGMQETACTTMREALEKDFADKFDITFDEEGNIASLGALKAENGYSFFIYESTTQGKNLIDKTPEQIELADSASYEIEYTDPNGDIVSILK